MTDTNWFFIGTDPRLAMCSEMLSERGFNSYHIGTDQYTEQLGEQLAELAPKHIVFPILQMKGTIPPEALVEGARLYTGVASEEWLAPFKESGFSVQPYLKDEQFIWQNARLTAEAFVHVYYANLQRQIAGSSFAVAGFGKVGKATAHVLASLGARVTVIARSAAQLGEAEAMQYETIQLTDDFHMNEGQLVNTIPAKWLSLPEGSTLRVFDLASAPGCLKEQPPSEYYTIHLGLPGKHFPVDAAAALADALERMYSR
ncbi:hypothetical protein MKY34_18330 [Sporosarcina sp. FSL K6-1522]|uniref:NAD(P)-dependent oxidoreductase n=1 Tax=Sporosarcina sp. FSL K6-1522 TaxID=2921554 RepID=UPI00315A503C